MFHHLLKVLFQLQEKNKFIEDKLDVLKIFEIKDNQIAEFLKKIDIISDDKNVNQVMNYNNYGSNESLGSKSSSNEVKKTSFRLWKLWKFPKK